jgi:WhiB family transcriptional regulator, redox-sensing transcriptional regulator
VSNPFGGDAYVDRNCAGVDTNLFFPDETAVVQATRAKSVCKGCVVREECLDFALVNGFKFGIWGGLSERARRKMRRQRKLAS